MFSFKLNLLSDLFGPLEVRKTKNAIDFFSFVPCPVIFPFFWYIFLLLLFLFFSYLFLKFWRPAPSLCPIQPSSIQFHGSKAVHMRTERPFRKWEHFTVCSPLFLSYYRGLVKFPPLSSLTAVTAAPPYCDHPWAGRAVGTGGASRWAVRVHCSLHSAGGRFIFSGLSYPMMAIRSSYGRPLIRWSFEVPSIRWSFVVFCRLFGTTRSCIIGPWVVGPLG